MEFSCGCREDVKGSAGQKRVNGTKSREGNLHTVARRHEKGVCGDCQAAQKLSLVKLRNVTTGSLMRPTNSYGAAAASETRHRLIQLIQFDY